MHSEEKSRQFLNNCERNWDDHGRNLTQMKNFMNRSSHRRYFVKTGGLKNYAKFTRKHLCWSLVFRKVAGLRLAKKETPTQVFSCEFCEIFKNTFFTEHLWTTASVWINSKKIFIIKRRQKYSKYHTSVLLTFTIMTFIIK